MTDINNAAVNTDNNAEVEAPAAADTKKGLVTLKSALEAHNVSELAAVLARMGKDVAAVQKFGLTFNLALKEAKEIKKAEEKAKEKAAEEAAKRREDKKAERIAANEALTAEREAEAAAMLVDLQEKLGDLSLDVLQEMVAAAMAAKYPVSKNQEKAFTFNRVEVKIGDEIVLMGFSGNMPNKLKDAVAASGLERDDFILANAVDVEKAKEVQALGNGAKAE